MSRARAVAGIIAIVLVVVVIGAVECTANANRRDDCRASGRRWIDNGPGEYGGCVDR